MPLVGDGVDGIDELVRLGAAVEGAVSGAHVGGVEGGEGLAAPLSKKSERNDFMGRYVFKRLLMLIPVTLGVVFIVFTILRMSPTMQILSSRPYCLMAQVMPSGMPTSPATRVLNMASCGRRWGSTTPSLSSFLTT